MTVIPVRLATETPVVSVKDADDESLALRLKDGDDVASEELVRRYATPLLRYLQRLSGNDHAAEELFQQTWLSVVEHVDRFNPSAGGGFKAWVYRIATNKANDLWRSKGREKNAKAGLKLVTDETGPDASYRLDGNEQEQRLRKALAQLPEPQRQVLLLRYYSEMKFVDIAKMLGCPLNTALGRMHKAMQKLKQMMED
jgi:RNA polymerase sigma-70 factor (ECF subfamily)